MPVIALLRSVLSNKSLTAALYGKYTVVLVRLVALDEFFQEVSVRSSEAEREGV